ncbi:30S ribosomal protein S4 [Candidatus Pacearchaeota archaeon]|nr:30S ribosomal protein S4 [Candidatus Pacearchaeota archaeon]
MKKKHKQYSRPKRPFDKNRIIEEEKIKNEFGLKNKKEIWRSEARIKDIRRRAISLIQSNPEEQKKFFEKLGKIGFKANSIADVLSLDKKDYLRRRFQTVVVSKKIARTPKHARQLIVHRKILVDGKAINSPSYIVPVGLESKISLKTREKSKKVAGEDSRIAQEKNEEEPENKTEIPAEISL